MRIADQITIIVGGEVIELRPCLRFAMRLERRPGSFEKLLTDVADGSLSAAVEIVGDHTGMLFLKNHVFEALPSIGDALVAYVMACVGINSDNAPSDDKKAKGKSAPLVSFTEHLADLYRIGTGWLGWTPTQTLDATPAEIMEAFRGRQEMLKAIFGGAEEKSEPKGDWGARFAFAARARTKAENEGRP